MVGMAIQCSLVLLTCLKLFNQHQRLVSFLFLNQQFEKYRDNLMERLSIIFSMFQTSSGIFSLICERILQIRV